MIILTENAIKELNRTYEEQNLDKNKIYLRLRIIGSGCAGFSCKLDLDENINLEKDDLFEINGIKVVIDKRSGLYLEGTKVDYMSDLNQMGFKVDIAGAKGRCGCGSSFEL